MQVKDKIKNQIMTEAELRELRKGFAEIEKLEAKHQQAKKLLQETRDKVEGIINAITDHMSMVDKDHNILWANEVAKGLFGPDLIGKKCHAVYHRRENPCEPCIVTEVFKDGQIHEHETEVIGKNGRIMNFWCTASVAGRHRDGRPKMVVKVSRDITERKRAEEEIRKLNVGLERRVIERTARLETTIKELGQEIKERQLAEEALRESEQKYRTLVENIPQKIFFKDRNLVYVSCNEYFAADHKIRSEDIVGKTDYDLFPKELAEKYQTDDKRVMDLGETEEIEEQYLRDGQEFIVFTVKTPVKDKDCNILGILGIFRDITEHKRAEKALKASEENYRLLVNNIPALVFKGYANGTVDFFDDKVKLLTGYDKEEFNSRRLKWTDLILEEDLADFKRVFIQALKTDGVYVREYGIKTQQGNLLWVQERSHIICDQHGKIEDVRGVFFDITEQKLAEEALFSSIAKLQSILKGTVHALAAMVESRDPYTAGHQHRVAQLAGAIAQEMGFSQDQIKGILVMGCIHDIGKIAIPTEILTKPGEIGEHEFNIIKTHSRVGYNILKNIEFPWPVARAILQHHERLDGSGYPLGVSGPNIIIDAKILAVADVVEAMTSHRPYRPALGIEHALEEISRGRGHLYDPDVVDACLRLFNEKGFKFD